MKRDQSSRLSDLRRSGEVRTGRQFADDIESSRKNDLFPGEGREVETAFGQCYMREIRFPLEYQHGNSTLSGALCCCGPDLALTARDRALHSFNLQKSLFLDIETTGLSGGTGTWAFLIGLGWLEENSFLLRQYFLRRPAEERAILSHFGDATAGFPAMVTFNGKMFDLPLIQTRQMLTGFKEINPPLHLDLLQCARALWKKRLASRALRSLEEELLGLKRYDDIPGAEIPAVYFEYLRRGKTGQLIKVFEHNVLDILSMVTLLEKIARLSAGEGIEHPAEELALGQLCLQSGRIAEGVEYLRRASSKGSDPLAEEAALELSFYFKRQRRWLEAAEVWQEAVTNKSANPTVYIELAKYYEHRCRKYQAALSLTEQAIALTASRQDIPISSECSLPALKHRQQRLWRRLAQL